jgi:hypothetical protein
VLQRTSWERELRDVGIVGSHAPSNAGAFRGAHPRTGF